MLTRSQDTKTHDEMILEKDSFHAELESGNPFLANQDITLSRSSKKHIKSSTPDQLGYEKSLTDAVESFFDNNIELSIKRVNRRPNNPDIRNALADNYLKVCHTQKAIDEYSHVLTLDKHNFRAWVGLARCHLQTGEIDEAIRIYEDLRILRPDDLSVILNLSMMYFTKRDLDTALKYLSEGRRKDSNNTAVLNNIGLVNIAKGDSKTALSFFRKAAAVDNSDALVHNNMGVAFLFQGNLRKAIICFSRALSFSENAREVLINLGNVYLLQKKYEKVIELLEEYLLRNPNEIELRNIYSWSLFQTGKHNRCLRTLKTALDITDSDDQRTISSLINNIGVVLNHMKKRTEAKRTFQTSIKAFPQEALVARCNLIDTLFADDDLQEVERIIQDGLSYNKEDPTLLSYLGDYFCKREDFQAAEELYLKILTDHPDCLPAYISLSWIETDIKKEPEKAISIAKKGLKYYPNNIALINNYTYAMVVSGKLEEAKKILDKVEDKESVQITATKGLICIMEDDIDAGRTFYNLAMKLAGDDVPLANLVKQKKNLELAKYFSKKNIKKEAIRYLKKATDCKTREKHYLRDAQQILEELQ